ncbi:TPA: hypothetical protein I8Y21_004570 [Klebsiella oxytoca]|uniref:Uncharacterized protein n=1 Tax=Klebsiella oxytoca TaxID=571 RepID=A0AAN5LD21_KLEOX|nr:hypothetical protein [Klebsiella oxytoca]
MNTFIKNVPIARVGKIIDGREVTMQILEHCMNTFNPEGYQPAVGELKNPEMSADIHSQGKVEHLKLEDGTLFADLEMYMPVADVKKLCQFPAIAYRKPEKPETPALMYVILDEIPNRKDCIALNDCEMTEVTK